MKLFKDLLNTVLVPYRVRKERRPVTEFVVYYPDEESQKPAGIKDISSTGVYLLTDERWMPGTRIPLTLQRKGPIEEDPTCKITLQGRVVRWGEDGVGLVFTPPTDVNFDLWKAVLANAANQTSVDDIIPPFRMAKALAFLCRLCPDATEEMTHLMQVGLGSMCVANAVQIALSAESLLAAEPDGDKMHANPQTVLRIIADGSWADEDWIRQLWVGLLAASCAVEATDQLGSDFADRLSQMAPVHVRIFKVACTRAEKYNSGDGQVVAKPLSCSVNDIQQTTGVQSHTKIESDIIHLATLDILESAVRARSFLLQEEIDLTPSKLGLEMYARCHGHRGNLQEFYATNR